MGRDELQGCHPFGLHDQTWNIDGHAVRVSRAGIAIDGSVNRALAHEVCRVAIGRVRPISLAPPDNAAPGGAARHFIELVVWIPATDQRSVKRTGPRRYAATWLIFEVHGRELQFHGRETVHETSEWPGAAVPADLDTRLMMEMIRSGHVTWRIDDAPPRRGWFMRPEQKTGR
jgi:hypothetical protein